MRQKRSITHFCFEDGISPSVLNGTDRDLLKKKYPRHFVVVHGPDRKTGFQGPFVTAYHMETGMQERVERSKRTSTRYYNGRPGTVRRGISVGLIDHLRFLLKEAGI